MGSVLLVLLVLFWIELVLDVVDLVNLTLAEEDFVFPVQSGPVTFSFHLRTCRWRSVQTDRRRAPPVRCRRPRRRATAFGRRRLCVVLIRKIISQVIERKSESFYMTHHTCSKIIK